MGDSTHRGVPLRYAIDRAALSARLADRVVTLGADEATRAWIDDCLARPHGGLTMAAQSFARQFLSDYDANGLVGAHDMRVLGTDQWRTLLAASSAAPLEGAAPTARLLDIGAGDGHVTAELAPLAAEVVTTETSSQMAKRLRRRGWTCHEVDVATAPLPDGGPFDLLALLNVLDRTSFPITLLERLRALAADDARLLVAVPFPLRPHVHAGPVTVDPEELLPIDDGGFAAQASTLAELLFAPTGWEVVALARAPYLCRGGRRRPVIALDDALFVCAPGPAGSGLGGQERE
ncbi:MAG TPA: methyltransferase domain-containing protein [Polyangiaceae bacterium LLY-WYZ-15_(1-7)]|nr:hypothetical protein [Sandaracinus sp.]HJL03010.1 methyltransferase domain-containing protein [Polyangiaceae bacterium LLY-WYZ-15_(1-7)]MBJ70861.1 hypothetical protein [Sandaracinus sp.]HJL13602.1 methyltransferase domain-containing protein [Polyangiaceae bacterium LLY-WYZ-15_(1-7)]HJL22890.1 methyltransferase domain-containing protein [Polyangiaceae bacterium LLY-WYZ-15_(1-7)]